MSIFLWVFYLILGILLTMLFMVIVQAAEKAWFRKHGVQSGPSVLDSPVVCILIDIIIYLFFGFVLRESDYPVWAIVLYAIAYEVITQCFLTYAFPQFWNASWIKSVVDVIAITIAYAVGQALKKNAQKQGRGQILDRNNTHNNHNNHNSCCKRCK